MMMLMMMLVMMMLVMMILVMMMLVMMILVMMLVMMLDRYSDDLVVITVIKYNNDASRHQGSRFL